MCESWDMSQPFDIAVLRQRISAIMERKKVKPTTLSLQIGNSSTLVKDLLEKTGDVKLGTLYKIAKALDCEISDLLSTEQDVAPARLGPRLFVKGAVAAGEWVEAYEWPHADWEEFTGRDNVDALTEHRFGLRVVGDSMDELYPDGTIVECVSVFGRAEIAPGKKVVIVRKRADELIEATVKELVEINGKMWARPKSSNPMHQAFDLNEPGEGIKSIRVAAVVVSSVREE